MYFIDRKKIRGKVKGADFMIKKGNLKPKNIKITKDIIVKILDITTKKKGIKKL